MPNWCENKLTVTGSSEEVKLIRECLLSENPQTHEVILDFNRLIPMPEAVQITCRGWGERSQFLLEKSREDIFDDEVIERLMFIYQINESKVLSLSLRARQECWTIGDFIQWLDDDANRQQELCFDLHLDRLYAENQIKYGASHWYDWAYSHWGCKWNADTHYISEEENSIICDFDTPWGPPENWFGSLCEEYPNLLLRLDYYESGGNFAGSIENINGSCIHHQFDKNKMQEFTLGVFGYYFGDEVETK